MAHRSSLAPLSFLFFMNKSLREHNSALLCTHRLWVVSCYKKSSLITTETMHPTKPKPFTTGAFTKKVCWPQSNLFRTGTTSDPWCLIQCGVGKGPLNMVWESEWVPDGWERRVRGWLSSLPPSPELCVCTHIVSILSCCHLSNCWCWDSPIFFPHFLP